MRNSKFIASLMCFNIMVSCVIDAFVIISPRSTITCAATGRRVDIIQLQGMINNNKENDGDVGEGGKEDKIDRIMNLETEKNDNLVTYEELSRDPELLQMEGQSSKKNFNKLFLLDRVGRAFNAFFLSLCICWIYLKSKWIWIYANFRWMDYYNYVTKS